MFDVMGVFLFPSTSSFPVSIIQDHRTHMKINSFSTWEMSWVLEHSRHRSCTVSVFPLEKEKFTGFFHEAKKWKKYSGFLSHVTSRWETMRNAMERLAQWKEGYACLITTRMDWGAGVTTFMLLFWSAGAVGVNTQRRIHKHSCSFFISYLLLMITP